MAMSMSQEQLDSILKKFDIQRLNAMQLEARKTIRNNDEVVLLSPTGSGKTLAFLLPLLDQLSPKRTDIQAIIITPTRELAIQIEQVARKMGSGYKINVVYGGRSASKDREELQTSPAILVGTPGRIADHIRSKTIDPHSVSILVLDEYDKSLEIGFEKEMSQILRKLNALQKKILTSATDLKILPEFIGLKDPITINYLDQRSDRLQIKVVESPDKAKLETLSLLLQTEAKGRGIVFCNFKDTIHEVSEYLDQLRLKHSCFYGGLEQRDRERGLIKFRNGTSNILLSTDLASRGIDVPALDFVIHFEIPQRLPEFTHRNGRTARMHDHGVAFIIKWVKRDLPDYMPPLERIELNTDDAKITYPQWQTIFVSGGRRDKISKGDIAGFFMKKGELEKGELGVIELKTDCAFVAVANTKTHAIIKRLNNQKIKGRKVRIYQLD